MKKAIIMGAGPAGLTAAYELLTRTDIKPVIIELDNQVGGLSKTINYKGNLIDIGGHRFFPSRKELPTGGSVFYRWQIRIQMKFHFLTRTRL